jgi:hypothetical protein
MVNMPQALRLCVEVCRSQGLAGHGTMTSEGAYRLQRRYPHLCFWIARCHSLRSGG